MSKLYDRIIDKKLLVRRITLSVGKVHSKQDVEYQQLNLFTDYAALKKEQEKVILVGVSERDGDDGADSLEELSQLARTAGAVVT